ARRLVPRGRADARHLPGPQQVLRGGRPRHRRRRAGLGQRVGPRLAGMRVSFPRQAEIQLVRSTVEAEAKSAMATDTGEASILLAKKPRRSCPALVRWQSSSAKCRNL